MRSSFCREAIRTHYPESVNFPEEKLQKNRSRLRIGKIRIEGCSALSQRKSGLIGAVSEGLSGYQLFFRKNQRWNNSN